MANGESIDTVIFAYRNAERHNETVKHQPEWRAAINTDAVDPNSFDILQ